MAGGIPACSEPVQGASRPARPRGGGGRRGGVHGWLGLTGHLGAGPAEDAATGAELAAAPADAFALTVVRVIDGDTFTAVIGSPPSGIPAGEEVSVRLIGIDTAETHPDVECWGPEATVSLRAMLPEGATAWAVTDRETFDRYHRVLLYVWTDGGRFVNRELVSTGDAEAMIVAPNDTHQDLLLSAQADARSAGIGRWGACG